MRLNNLSALIVDSQIPYLDERIENGRRNHDIAAKKLSHSEWIHVPEKFEHEARAQTQYNSTCWINAAGG